MWSDAAASPEDRLISWLFSFTFFILPDISSVSHLSRGLFMWLEVFVGLEQTLVFRQTSCPAVTVSFSHCCCLCPALLLMADFHDDASIGCRVRSPPTWLASRAVRQSSALSWLVQRFNLLCGSFLSGSPLHELILFCLLINRRGHQLCCSVPDTDTRRRGGHGRFARALRRRWRPRRAFSWMISSQDGSEVSDTKLSPQGREGHRGGVGARWGHGLRSVFSQGMQAECESQTGRISYCPPPILPHPV